MLLLHTCSRRQDGTGHVSNTASRVRTWVVLRPQQSMRRRVHNTCHAVGMLCRVMLWPHLVVKTTAITSIASCICCVTQWLHNSRCCHLNCNLQPQLVRGSCNVLNCLLQGCILLPPRHTRLLLLLLKLASCNQHDAL